MIHIRIGTTVYKTLALLHPTKLSLILTWYPTLSLPEILKETL